MEDHTIHLDWENPRKARFFWATQVALAAIFVLQGVMGIYSPPAKLPFFPYVQFAMGGLLLGAVAGMIITRRKFGPLRIVFTSEVLEVKTRVLSHARRIPWSQVSEVRFALNQADIVPSAPDVEPITLKLGSYVLNRLVKQDLREYADAHGIPVTEK
ncbi:MAG: hypothetical protein QGI83_00215 [Candidatus Latescibacteria bacterium]|nr:hypothetical protein [Candidatus Latescibacterota bacterium]